MVGLALRIGLMPLLRGWVACSSILQRRPPGRRLPSLVTSPTTRPLSRSGRNCSWTSCAANSPSLLTLEYGRVGGLLAQTWEERDTGIGRQVSHLFQILCGTLVSLPVDILKTAHISTNGKIL